MTEARPQPAPFSNYARWYDAFNASKPYADEVDHILTTVPALVRPGARWVDIGCGTGRHLARLQQRGFVVEGIDRSEEMVSAARAAHPGIQFCLGNAQSFSLDRPADVISMLFHVLDYQVRDDQLSQALRQVSVNLRPAGRFVFDFWNEGAVRRHPPAVRIRQTDIKGRALFRTAVPFLGTDLRLVRVSYEFRWDAPDGEVVHEEQHVLRPFTREELRERLAEAGLELAGCLAWMTGQHLTDDNWYGFGWAIRQEAM